MAIRKSEIEVYARVGITEESYYKLREMKKGRKQSMARIMSDLIMLAAVVEKNAGVIKNASVPAALPVSFPAVTLTA